ncbi:DUF2007 domain-containing protein [Flavobacteriaceae bacterium F08102]|nr:DUF2007 domain-containing protein [Flavobacteriaceae bacterium F08102]
MNSNYSVVAVFEYSTEAYFLKAKLQAEGIKVVLVDETTIDADPLISQAIGGVKLTVRNEDYRRAMNLYNQYRTYVKAEDGSVIHCPSCNATQILIAPLERKNIFYMLFPFFEKKRHICNECKTIF